MPEETTGNNDIQSLRTFALDMENARGETSEDVSFVEPTEEEMVTPAPETSEEEKSEAEEKEVSIPKRPQVTRSHKSAADFLSQPIPNKTEQTTTPDTPVTTDADNMATNTDNVENVEVDTEVVVPTAKMTIPAETENIPTEDPLAEMQEKITVNPEDLQDEIDDVAIPTQQSILSHNDEMDLAGEEGTIIEDQKRKRFKLLPAIADAIRDWFGEKQADYVESQKPTHTMLKAEARVETIKAAAKASLQAPVADHQTVLEQYKDAEVPEIDNAILVKERDAVPEPAWGHYKEGAAAAEQTPVSPAPPPPTVTERKIQVTEHAFHAPAVKPDFDQQTDLQNAARWEATRGTDDVFTEENTTQLPDPVPEPELTPAATVEEVPAEPATQELTEVQDTQVTSVTEEAVPEPTAETVVPQIVNEEMPVSAPPVPETPIPTPRRMVPPAPKLSLKERISNTPIYVAIIVLLFVCAAGVSTSVYLLQSKTETTETPTPILSENTLLPQATVSNVVFTQNHNELFSSIESVRHGDVTRYLSFTENERPVATEVLLRTLAPNASGPFVRTVNELVFGYTDISAPFIIMRGTNFDSLFGGLLAWETTMSSDLSPIFGIGVPSEQIRGIGGNRGGSSTFVDTVIAGRSARVLVDSSNSERLLYIFLSDTSVLIAPNRASARSLIEFITP